MKLYYPDMRVLICGSGRRDVVVWVLEFGCDVAEELSLNVVADNEVK